MSCNHDINAVDDATLDLPLSSLSCANCLRRISPWAGSAVPVHRTLASCPRSAHTPDDKKRLQASTGETSEARKCEVGAKHKNSENDGRSLFYLSDAEKNSWHKWDVPDKVPAQLLAENLKLKTKLKKLEPVSLIGDLVDGDEKEVQQQKPKEVSASNAYTKPGGNRFRDSTKTCRNFVSHAAGSIASGGRGRRRLVSAASACATTTVHEAPTHAARIYSESLSSPFASAVASSETVSKVDIFKHNFLHRVTAHENAKTITDPLSCVSNSGAASNPDLRRPQLGCDAEHGGDALSSRLASISYAHSLLSARVTSPTTGNGQSSRSRSPDACTSEGESYHVFHPIDGRSKNRQRSVSPDISRLVTAPRIGCRGRRVFRSRRFGSPQSSVATTCYAPASQAGRRRYSRGSTGRINRSRSPVARIPSVTASRIGGRGRGGSTRRVGSRTRGGLHGSRFGKPQSPDGRASCDSVSRAGRPRGRRGSRLHFSMSRSPVATIFSSTVSRRCRISKRGRRGCSKRPLSPDGSSPSVQASFIRGRRVKSGKPSSSSVPRSPDSRTPSESESHIDSQQMEACASALRRCWNRSRSRFVSRSLTPARVRGCGRHSRASPLLPRSSVSALWSSSAAVQPDLTADTELTAPVVCNDLARDEAVEAAAAADEAVRAAAAAPPPLSPGCSQPPQSDAEMALHMQNLYNFEHKYRLNGLRVPESDGEYGLRSCSGRRDCRTGFSTAAARSADSHCSCCRQSNGRVTSASSLLLPATARRRASGSMPM